MIMISQSMRALPCLDDNDFHLFEFSTQSTYTMLSHIMQS